jgi:hypothetical protein
LNAKEPGEWVKEHGLGVCISDPAEIPGIYYQHKRIRKHLKKYQTKWCMEQQVDKIKAMYDRLVK